jgi:hypothetical protein
VRKQEGRTIPVMTKSKSNVSRATRAKSGGQALSQPCECCGIASNAHGRPLSVTFEQPDVVFDIEPELLETWGGDPFLAIKNVGFFVRVILPVRLTDGFAVDFGTWLEVYNEDFKNAWQTWNFPEYKDLVLEGYVANKIEPWGKLPHGMVKAAVRDMEQVPYINSAENPDIARIIGDVWPHADVLKSYSELLKTEPPFEN